MQIREKEEVEERKKRRVDDEEESKYDMASLFADSKRWRTKANKYNYGRRPLVSSRKTVMTGVSSSGLKKLPLSSLNSTDGHNDSKTPIKKK